MPPLAVRPQRARLLQRAQQFADEERVPLGAAVDEPGEPVGVGGGEAIAAGDEGAGGRRVERAQVQSRGPRLAHERRHELVEGMAAGQLVGTIRHDQQHTEYGERAGEEAEQIEAGEVGPVQIIEQEQRVMCRDRAGEIEHLLEERRLARHFAHGPLFGECIGQRQRV